MKFKHEYHYVPKELITNEAIHSAVVYALECAGGVVSKGFGAYGDRHRDSKGLSIADSSRILWSSHFANEPVTLQQLFNHEDFEWPEGMDIIGYVDDDKVVFYNDVKYSYPFPKYGGVNEIYLFDKYLTLIKSSVTLIATKESQEENMNKEFTKDMLVAGKHIVELRNGARWGLFKLSDKVVGFNLQNKINNHGLHQNWYKHLGDDLTYHYNDDYTVVKVYEAKNVDVYYYCTDKNLTLVWERNEKSKQEIEYESLMNKIAELEAQARKLKP